MPDEIYKFIGGKIRTFREQHGMNQEALADELEVTANTVSRWETATYKPSVKELEKMSRFFGVPLWTFLPSEIEPPTKEQKALLSATGDLPTEDLEELRRYADFIRARKAISKPKTKKGRNK